MALFFIIIMSFFIFGSSLDPKNPKKILNKGHESEYKSVLGEYQKLINKYPNNSELKFNLGNIHYMYGNTPEAISQYQDLLNNSDAP